ncbi:hypothetical protein M5689_008225 [Euphorbia peplus]|nr:hypothetical protein M5689_008225 [Euphorbia peplus]
MSRSLAVIFGQPEISRAQLPGIQQRVCPPQNLFNSGRFRNRKVRKLDRKQHSFLAILLSFSSSSEDDANISSIRGQFMTYNRFRFFMFHRTGAGNTLLILGHSRMTNLVRFEKHEPYGTPLSFRIRTFKFSNLYKSMYGCFRVELGPGKTVKTTPLFHDIS